MTQVMTPAKRANALALANAVAGTKYATIDEVKGAIKVMKSARAKIEAGWVQAAFNAKDEQGNPCYCAVGAIRSAAADWRRNAGMFYGRQTSVCYRALLEAIKTNTYIPGNWANAENAIYWYNDQSEREQREVARKMGKAVQILEQVVAYREREKGERVKGTLRLKH